MIRLVKEQTSSKSRRSCKFMHVGIFTSTPKAAKNQKYYMNQFERLEKLILNSDGLTIREDDFIPSLNKKPFDLLYTDWKCLRDVMEKMDHKFSYRVYFSIPHLFNLEKKLEVLYLSCGEIIFECSDTEIFPEGSVIPADFFLRDVIPQWTRRISSDWFDSKFSQLDKKLESAWTQLDGYCQKDNFKTAPWVFRDMYNLRATLPSRIEIRKECNKEEIVSEIYKDVLYVLERYFAMLEIKKSRRRFNFNLCGSVFRAHPDYVYFDSEGNLCFFVRFKRHGLTNYVDEKGIKDTDEMNSIMKGVLSHMVATRTDICIISDIEVSILVQLDFEGSPNKIPLEDDSSARVPFKYHIFHPDDTIYTLQAIICSVAYDQKLRFGDPIQKENVDKLKALLAQEGSKIQSPINDKASSRSDSQTDHSPRAELRSPSTQLSEQVPSIPENLPKPKTNWIKYKNLEFSLNEGEFEILQPGGYHLNTVLKLNRCAIEKNLPHLKIPPSVSYVIMKIYDLSASDIYIECHELELKTSYGEVKDFMGSKFETEIECYKRTNKYNETRGEGEYLRVPQMYEHGGGYIRKGKDILSFGWYLIVEYIEKDKDQRFDFKDAEHQIKLLGTLGIQHNDIHQRNIAVSQEKFTLIDFSEAKLDNIDLSWDLKNLDRVWTVTQHTREGSENFREQLKAKLEYVEYLKARGTLAKRPV